MVNIRNSAGHTPLHIACKGKDSDLMQTLLRLGADPTIEDGEGLDCLAECPMTASEIEAMRERQAVAGRVEQEVILEEEEEEEDEEEGEGDKQSLFVLWPPAQRQSRQSDSPLVLTSTDTMYVHLASDEVDVYPLLSWSGLLDIMVGFLFLHTST